MTDKFDRHTGLPVKQTVAPLNTRTMLFHPTRPAIIIEGKGDNDAQRRTSADAQIKQKLGEGYTRERGHGQHPHSNDFERVELQKRLAEQGDKRAAAALKAKGHPVPAAEKNENEKKD